jgi:hypothetical protein
MGSGSIESDPIDPDPIDPHMDSEILQAGAEEVPLPGEY